MNTIFILMAVAWLGGLGIILVQLRNLILFVKSRPFKKIEDLTDEEKVFFHDYVENLYGKDVADNLVEIRKQTPVITVLDAREVIKKYSNINAIERNTI